MDQQIDEECCSWCYVMSTVRYVDDTVTDCAPRDGDLGTCTKIDTLMFQLH